MAVKKENSSDFAGREILVERVLNAPVELVWEVWTKPEHIKNWWGPNGFTNTITRMEVKPGGAWELTMHGPDGTNYPNKSIYKEVVKHKLIVMEHLAPNFIATVNFTAEGKKTHIKWHMLFETKELFEMVVKNHKADKGLEQNVEKLAVYLASTDMDAEHKAPFTITRVFNAPLQLVYQAWTDPRHMARWWGPKYFTNPVCEMDVRPGGAIRIDMTFPDGTPTPMTGVFTEVEEQRKLVFRCFAFFDKAGDNQLEVINTAIFEEEGGKTKVTIHAEVVKASGEAEGGAAGMSEGWSQSLDKLDMEVERMTRPDYHCSILVNTDVKKALEGISNVTAWWATGFEGSAQKQDDVFTVHFGDTLVNFKVVELTGKSAVWQVTGCYLPWLKDKLEWKGTCIVWEVYPLNGATQIDMTHLGLVPAMECYGECIQGWNFYATESLYQLLTTGKGRPDTPKAAR